MNNKNMNMHFVRMMNFSEKSNKAVNKAIRYSINENCAEVNSVHLFLALVERTDLGEQILDYMGTTFDMFYSSYQYLASDDEYGITDHTDETAENMLEMFSRDLFITISTITAKCMQKMKEVEPDDLLDELLNVKGEELDHFLHHIGITYEEIERLKYSTFSIPNDLVDFIEDLNDTVANKKDTITNVDNYINEMVEVLSRKLKANPCLIGEAGVGKTTIVKGLAQRIVSGNVPEQFKNMHIIYINSALLTSGTRYRGDFEERMKCLLDWASKSNVILFLDEIHTFINLGKNGDNSADTAGNMIKKHLSDGDIRIIGATTTKEYHKFIEVDSAFDRRLQTVTVKEPNVEEAIAMISNTITDYEKFHKLKIDAEAIESAVKLSNRYMKDKFLPDKAYTILDQASAKVKLANKKEVTVDDITSVISKITSIDLNKLNTEESKQLLSLEKTIGKNLIGQENAVKTVCKAIRRAKTGISEPNKPLASFLFVGPTGVGKTELCKVLSKEVAIGDTPLIKVDMSEYSEKASISKMIGSAPGYVGYGEGGQLTEKIKHNPYSIILFDEIEKAHPEVFNVFLQLLDEGKLTDGEGNAVDFTNCIVVLTSNAGYGADGMNKKALGFGASDTEVSPRETERKALRALEDTFKPEFLNRIDNVVIFEKLDKKQCAEIVKLMLNKLSDRLTEQGIELKFDKTVVNRVVELGYSDKYGARNLRREIQDTVEDFVSDAILSGALSNDKPKKLFYRQNKLELKEVK